MLSSRSCGGGDDGAFLDVNAVTKRFQGLVAVKDVSFTIGRGEMVSIIGPNGAGKTTLFNLLTGQLKPTEGEVRLHGSSVNALGPHDRARRGMGRTFQIARPLKSLSVLENVMVGAFLIVAGAGSRRPRRSRFWRRSGCRIARPIAPASSRSASAGAWRWHGRSRSIRRSSCSMRSWRASSE